MVRMLAVAATTRKTIMMLLVQMFVCGSLLDCAPVVEQNPWKLCMVKSTEFRGHSFILLSTSAHGGTTEHAAPFRAAVPDRKERRSVL